MFFKEISFVLVCLILLFSCSKPKEQKKASLENVLPKVKKLQEIQKLTDTSRLLFLVHAPSMKNDHFKSKGLITREDFIKEFEKVNWKKEVDVITESFTVNPTRLEVLDSLKYLSITVGIGAKTSKVKEFTIGIGDIEIENNEKVYFVDLYGTKGMDKNKVIEIINIFFDKESNDLIMHLDEFDNYAYLKDPHVILE